MEAKNFGKKTSGRKRVFSSSDKTPFPFSIVISSLLHAQSSLHTYIHRSRSLKWKTRGRVSPSLFRTRKISHTHTPNYSLPESIPVDCRCPDVVSTDDGLICILRFILYDLFNAKSNENKVFQSYDYGLSVACMVCALNTMSCVQYCDQTFPAFFSRPRTLRHRASRLFLNDFFPSRAIRYCEN